MQRRDRRFLANTNKNKRQPLSPLA